jgi:hypothetical protein
MKWLTFALEVLAAGISAALRNLTSKGEDKNN